MAEIQRDTDVAVEFLEAFRPGGPWIMTAIGTDRPFIQTRTFDASSTDALRDWLAAQDEQRRNCYFHVNSAMRSLDKKAEKTDIATVDWLHVDIDPAPGFDLREEQKTILAALQKAQRLPPPTMIVFSGGGYQGFWKLREPIEIKGDVAKAEDAERYNQQVELLLGADPCHNVDRIMRVPGTVNYPCEKKRRKGRQPALATLVMHDPARVYPISAFTQAPKRQDAVTGGGTVPVQVSGNVRRIAGVAPEDGELPPEVSKRCREVIVHGRDNDQALTGDNSRSAWLFWVCCELVRAEVDDETIYAIITDPDFGISASVLDKGNSASVHRYACRQIQRAKEHNIEPWLEVLNREYAVVESVGNQFRIAREMYDHAKGRDEIQFMRMEGFMNTYCNQFVAVEVKTADGTKVKYKPVGRWWMEHPNRRTYRNVMFYPNHDFPDSMNMWRGFAFDAIPGDCSLYLNHIRKVLCKGNTEHYDYLVGWMANAVQRPYLPGQVAIVMRGEQGTGKGTFAKVFGRLFGAHYKYVNNPKHITGQFNFLLHDACVVFADECFVSGNPQHEAALKALITEDTIRVEQKNVDNLESRNCVHLIMGTNKEWAICAELSDRRFFVVELDNAHRVDIEYFSRMMKQMDEGGYEALLHYLLTYDLSGFDVRNCPKTDELRNQQEHSMEPMEAFWLNILMDGSLMPGHGGWRRQVIKNELTDAFLAEHSARGIKNVKMALGKFLAKLAGADSARARGRTFAWETARGTKKVEANPWMWNFPDLGECRRLWEQKFGPRPWPDDPGEPDDYQDEPNAEGVF